MWGPEVDVVPLSSTPHLVFETGFLFNLELTCWLRLADQCTTGICLSVCTSSVLGPHHHSWPPWGSECRSLCSVLPGQCPQPQPCVFHLVLSPAPSIFLQMTQFILYAVSIQHLLYPSFDGHLGRSLFLVIVATVNSTALNTAMQASLWLSDVDL